MKRFAREIRFPGLKWGKRFGQALIEFAVVLPLLLFLVFMLIEFARVFHAYLAVENGVRQGIRYAVTGQYEGEYCPEPDDRCETESDEQSARLESIRQVVYSASKTVMRDDNSNTHDPGYFKTTICVIDQENRYIAPDPMDRMSSASCSGGDDPGDPGDIVSVTVDFNHPLVIPVLADAVPVLHLHSRREAIVEDFRTNREVSLPPVFGTPDPGDPTPDPDPPDCSKMSMSDVRFDGSGFSAVFRNANDMDPALVYTEVRKGNPMSERLHYTYLNFPYLSRGSVYYWHDTMDYNDSISWSGNVEWPVGAEALWGADLTGDKPRFGVFSAVIRFEFSDGTQCEFTPYLEVEEPMDRPEITETPGSPAITTIPGRTDTPTPTATSTSLPIDPGD